MRIRNVSFGFALFALALSAQPPGGRGRFGGNSAPGPRFLGAEPGIPGRIVKNAPFTGDLVTETSQILSDGNHIRQSTTAHLVRDSEGRTRREQSLNGLGELGAAANNAQAVFISDPVAGVSYALNPSNRTVSKLAEPGRGRGGRNGKQPPAADAPRRGRGINAGESKTEALGRQTMEGVGADGSRVTQTIPAGAMGNELPIQVVTERWYSPDLHMDVLMRRNDPRYGETVTRLINISRAEPSHTLFEPPADYKTVEDRRFTQR